MDLAGIGARVRNARVQAGIKNLEQFADEIGASGCDRPSVAKLSRIETGEQPVSLDILVPVSKLTGIAPQDLRPDVAAKFGEQAEVAQ